MDAFRAYGHFEAKLDPLGLAQRPARPELAAAAAAADPATVEKLKATYAGFLGAEFAHLDSQAEREWLAAQLEAAMPAGGFELTVGQKRNINALLTQAETFEHFLGKKFVSLKRYSGEGTESLLPACDAVFAAAAEHDVKDVVIGMAHRGRLALLVSMLGYPARKLFHKIMGNNDIAEEVQGLDDVSSHIASSLDKSYGVGEKAKKIHVSLLHNPSHLEAVNPVAAGKAYAKQREGSKDALCLLIHGDAAVAGQGVVAEGYMMANLPAYSVGGTVHIVTNNQLGFTADERTGRSSAYASDMAKVIGAPVLHVNAEQPRELILACKLAVQYRQQFKKDIVIDMIGFRRHGHNELDEAGFTQPLMYKTIRGRPSFASSYSAQLEAEGVLTAEQRKALSERINAHLETEFKHAKEDYTASAGCLGAPAGPLGSGKHVVGDGTAFAGKWAGIRQAEPHELYESPATGVDVEALRAIGKASVTIPASVKIHDRLTRGHVQPRMASLGFDPSTGAEDAKWAGAAAPTVDWATAEALALGSLLQEGKNVRMTGQDVQRGTFSHRHAVLTDQNNGSKYCPLNNMQKLPGIAASFSSPAAAAGAVAAAGKEGKQVGSLDIHSSFLSELAVYGFEFGHSWENPDTMVLWEAQFGDFGNGAQIMIDQFLSGSESKWLRQSGMVTLLPHGYDGAGPEHSSARIERFLQLVNSQALGRGAGCLDASAASAAGHKDKTLREALNMIVANPSTPANYFHILRRQLVRPFRKPLVIIAPKTLLRHPQAVSSLQEMAPGTSFQPLLADGLLPPEKAGAAVAPIPSADQVKRVLLTSGKLYYELAKRRAELQAAGKASAAVNSTVMLRVEELAPFPTEHIVKQLQNYPGLKELAWCQEEPANAGAWTWAEAHLCQALKKEGMPEMSYIGRPALAAPAVGLSKLNKAQQDYIHAVALPSA